jgi:hypothetical protein
VPTDCAVTLEAASLSRLLSRSGLLLLALYAAVVLFDVLPPRLLDPNWILNFAATLVNFVSIPLAGMAFIHVAAYLRAPALGLFQLRISRLAAVMALLFILIQPMLIFAVHKNRLDLTRYNNQQVKLIKAKEKQLLNAISSSSSFEELRFKMSSLQGPAIPDQAREIPLAELKSQLLASIRDAAADLPNRLPRTNSPQYKQLYKNIFRTSFLGFLGFIGFGLMAWNPVTDKNIIFSYFGSIGLFGFKPANLKMKITNYLERRKAMADVKAARKLALQHEQRMVKQQSQQMRDQKRRINEDRKRAEKLERQRQRGLK